MRYKLAIFDFDGTLADSVGWFIPVLNELAPRHGFRSVSAAEIEDLRHCDNREIMRRLGVPLWKLPRIADDVRARMARDADQIRLFDGMAALLDTLHRARIVCAIVSSNAEANVRKILGPEGIAAVTHFDCGASLFGKDKKFRRTIKRAGVPPDQTICIGDEQRDVEAAHSAGAASGIVTWGYASPSLLARCGATLTFEKPQDIARALLPA